jgi:hydrogenase maturation protease
LKIRIIGCGNLIAGDDGVGVRAVQELRKVVSGEIELIDGGVRGLDLLDYFLDMDKVIVVDAIALSGNKGDCYRFTMEEIRAMGRDNIISLHQIGVAEVLKIGLMLYPDRIAHNIILIGMEIGKVENEFSTELSLPVEKALPDLLTVILRELEN